MAKIPPTNVPVLEAEGQFSLPWRRWLQTLPSEGSSTSDNLVFTGDVTGGEGSVNVLLTLSQAQPNPHTWATVQTFALGIVTSSCAFASLPPSPMDGQRAFIIDSTQAASGNYGAVAAGGGSDHVSVYFDDSAGEWLIG